MNYTTISTKKHSMFAVSFLASALLFLSMQVEAKNIIKMATTTSTENSGLLGWLFPAFEKESGIAIQAIAVGSGKALKLGENGDVDVLLVHARDAELDFVANGFGVDRREIMYNDFVIVGPPSDPASVALLTTAPEALRRIAGVKAAFISRGDESGTHIKEMELWGHAATKPAGKWYLQAGQGMEAVLVIASEMQAYTLTDRATYSAVEDNVETKILLGGDPDLFNQYGVIAINPEKHHHVKFAEAKQFISWICSKQGQDLIARFRLKGKQVFFPNATTENKTPNKIR